MLLKPTQTQSCQLGSIGVRMRSTLTYWESNLRLQQNVDVLGQSRPKHQNQKMSSPADEAIVNSKLARLACPVLAMQSYQLFKQSLRDQLNLPVIKYSLFLGPHVVYIFCQKCLSNWVIVVTIYMMVIHLGILFKCLGHYLTIKM
jgi:hypothetical protein